MVKLRSISFLLILLISLVACQTSTSEVADLPTLVDFPTSTNTYTPSPSFTPTNTPSPTATNTATATIPTNTPTPTASPTNTRPPSATPTASQTFTPTATDTPPASPTAIPTRTPDLPTIEVFQANNVQVSVGDPILLRWSASADSLRLETIISGVVTATQDVNLTGSLTTNAPSTNGQVVYRITATRGSNEIRSTVTIEVGSTCTLIWFFSNPPAGLGCPIAPPSSSPITFQQFQQGFMFRVLLNGNNRVCGVQTSANLYSCFAFQTFVGVPPVTPPSPFQPPANELAYSFYNDLATGGFWYDQIGWGMATASTSNGQLQVGDNGRIYVQLPNGIYSFDSGLSYFGAQVQRLN